MTPDDLSRIYLFRAACGLVAFAAYLGLLVRGYAFAKRSTSYRRRVFWTTALLTLFAWVAILLVSSLYLVAHPPVLVAVDPTPTMIQSALAAAIAVGGVVMWRTCPRPEDG